MSLIINISRELAERILERAMPIPWCGCHVWMGWNSDNGYGKVSVGGVDLMAHRVVYTGLIGPIPPGMFLDHLCRVRACIWPWHMEPVSPKVNTDRGEAILFKRAYA